MEHWKWSAVVDTEKFGVVILEESCLCRLLIIKLRRRKSSGTEVIKGRIQDGGLRGGISHGVGGYPAIVFNARGGEFSRDDSSCVIHERETVPWMAIAGSCWTKVKFFAASSLERSPRRSSFGCNCGWTGLLPVNSPRNSLFTFALDHFVRFI